jgi:hypothetical protein
MPRVAVSHAPIEGKPGRSFAASSPGACVAQLGVDVCGVFQRVAVVCSAWVLASIFTCWCHWSQEAEAVLQSAMAGRGQDRLVDLDAPTMKQSVAWELALRVIHIREVGLHVIIQAAAIGTRLRRI